MFLQSVIASLLFLSFPTFHPFVGLFEKFRGVAKKPKERCHLYHASGDITHDEIQKVGMKPGMNMVGSSFASNVENPLYTPCMFEAPSVESPTHEDTGMLYSSKHSLRT